MCCHEVFQTDSGKARQASGFDELLSVMLETQMVHVNEMELMDLNVVVT